MTNNVEHEIQRLMLERLDIEWTPGEPFYALVEDEIHRLKAALLLIASDGNPDAWSREIAAAAL